MAHWEGGLFEEEGTAAFTVPKKFGDLKDSWHESFRFFIIALVYSYNWPLGTRYQDSRTLGVPLRGTFQLFNCIYT